MTRLPRALLAIGSFVLVFSLWKIWQQASHDRPADWPSEWRYRMDENAAKGVRYRWVA